MLSIGRSLIVETSAVSRFPAGDFNCNYQRCRADEATNACDSLNKEIPGVRVDARLLAGVK